MPQKVTEFLQPAFLDITGPPSIPHAVFHVADLEFVLQVATRAREALGPPVDLYFKASVFARFAQDGDGGISAAAFAAYLGTRSTMHSLVRCALA